MKVQLSYKRIIEINEDYTEEIYDNETKKFKTVKQTGKVTTTENEINTEIHADQKVEFKNAVKLIKLILRPINDTKENKTETEKEKENDFSVFFYVIITFIWILILFFITVIVIKKKSIDI